MDNQFFDVAIIGGGPAGLNAALMLGRARKHVAVLDEGRPRNAVTHAMHGFLTRDGISPREFRRLAQEEIAAYPSVSFFTESVVTITGADGKFEMETLTGKRLLSKKILLAVGMKDRLPDIPGLKEVYGKSAFVCPYCDGWELRDQPLVLLNKGAELMHLAPILSGWTNRITVCTNGPDELTDTQRDELRRNHVPLFDSPIRRIDSKEGITRQVVLEDGSSITCRGIFFKPELVTGSNLPRTIGCQMTESGEIVVDEFGKTSIPGVYSAGDVTSRLHQAIAAASKGALTAAMINNELNGMAWMKNL